MKTLLLLFLLPVMAIGQTQHKGTFIQMLEPSFVQYAKYSDTTLRGIYNPKLVAAIQFTNTDTTTSHRDMFCWFEKASIKKVGDVDHVLRNMVMTRELDQRRLLAAEEILNYIRMDGTIDNKKEFDKAVKVYLQTRAENENLLMGMHK
jgi:hypothetical protein